jgi:2-polyprenyl-3-methyl-5-hydroxy-6-metoxy-1,4-benzoquinol methylase
VRTATVNCVLCGRDEWQVRYPATMNGDAAPDVAAFRCTSAGYGTHPQIVQCVSCGHVYANPRWMDEDLLGAYAAVEDEVYLAEREGREITFRHHLESLIRHTGPAAGRSLLDVGAYIGVFVAVAREMGWEAMGVEPSAWAANVAQAADLPVIEGTLESEALEGRRFAAITMWDVIEHVVDPGAELARAYELLAPGGVIAVHTMDIDSAAARLLGQRWPWLMDMHVHYFSQRTLRQLLQKQGFEVLWSGAQGRYLRLGYLATRLKGLSPALGRLAERVLQHPALARVAVPVNLGDLFTVFARRPLA